VHLWRNVLACEAHLIRVPRVVRVPGGVERGWQHVGLPRQLRTASTELDSLEPCCAALVGRESKGWRLDGHLMYIH
jgi:hypothetical protein